MNSRKLADRIGNIDSRLIQQAENLPDYSLRHRRNIFYRLMACAATIVLMLGSFAAGATVFAKEAAITQESVSLEEIGLTLLLPEEWKGNYSVEMGEMDGGYLYTFYDNEIHGQEGEWSDGGALFYIGTYGNTPMTEAELDAEHHHAYAYKYLFSTNTTNYIMVYVSDVQYDPADAKMAQHYEMLTRSIHNIKIVLENAL